MKSESKKVTQEDKKAEFMPKYQKHLDELKSKFEIEKNEKFSNLVNFSTNRKKPIHKWIDFKEGYSSKLVKELIDVDNLDSGDYILDPFVGCGTTCLVAQELGYPSIGVDILPVASLSTKVKTTNFSKEDNKKIKKYLRNLRNRLKTTDKIPEFKVLDRMFFSDSQKEEMLKLKGFWENIDEERIRDFFRLAYISIIEDVSNRKKDGNGIKYHRNKEVIQDPISYYEDKVISMYSDILQMDKSNKEPIVFNGSILEDEVYEEIKEKDIGSVVFSPPYANCFDYAEVYKMELWLGGFVEKYSDFDEYRNKAIRSHVNSKFDKTIENENEFVDVIAELVSAYNIWNKDIPDMIRGYFDDMTKVLKRLFSVMKEGSYCKIAVANSGYKGILVPTDLLLAEIGKDIGFNVEKIVHARDIRASSQQMEELHGNYENLMRESIVFLKKEDINREISQFV